MIPVNLKLATVVLIFKKGGKEDSKNYSHVSLTQVPGKIMEKIILVKDLKDHVHTGHSHRKGSSGESLF